MVVERVGGVKGSGCGGRDNMVGWTWPWCWCWGKVIGGEYVEASWGDFSESWGRDVFCVGDFLDLRDIKTPRTRRRKPPMNTYGRSRPGRLMEAVVSERTGIFGTWDE
jgi:hypothetical protein